MRYTGAALIGNGGIEEVHPQLQRPLDDLAGMGLINSPGVLSVFYMWDYQTPLYEIMDGLNNMVKAGKARYIGISNCFAWQLCKANALAEREGFPKFVSDSPFPDWRGFCPASRRYAAGR